MQDSAIESSRRKSIQLEMWALTDKIAAKGAFVTYL